jgi:hypothetical protein
MRRALTLTVVVLSFAILSFAQQVVVRSPNGSERLKKGDTVSINWGCVQCSGTTELHLVRVPTSPAAAMPTREGYQEIGVIKASIPVTPAQQSYSYNWRVGDYYGGTAQLGGGYKILVKVVTPAKTVSDLSDSGFVIGALPAMDYFAINDGLAVTNQRKVTLNYRTTGFPSPGGFRVRCTPPGTTKDATLASGTWPTHELPAEPGDYTIELSLMNDLGTGPSKTDTIRYELPPPPQKDFTVQPSLLVCGGVPEFRSAAWAMRLTSSTLPESPLTVPVHCENSDGTVHIELKGYPVGNKLEYEFFTGRQLNPGWSFVSLAYSDASCKNGAGSAILIMPLVGSRDIKFKVRVWADGPPTQGFCDFVIKSLVIRGPADQPVSNAFK